MTLNLSVLTKNELNTRKFWRNSFLAFYSLLIFCGLIGSVFLIISLEGMARQLGSATAEVLFIAILPAFILYHFAYKKAGTFILTLYLYLKPLDLLIKGLVIFSHLFPTVKPCL